MSIQGKIVKTTIVILGVYGLLSLLMILAQTRPDLVSSGEWDLHFGNWIGILTSIFLHESFAHLAANLLGIWSNVVLLIILCVTGMYVYDYPDLRKSVLVCAVAPIAAAILSNIIFYSHLTNPADHYLGASGLAYAVDGTALIVSVLYLRAAASFYLWLPRKAKLRDHATLTLITLVTNGMLALLVFARETDMLWNPTHYFNIAQNVGYQIHILGFILAILGAAFVIFITTFDGTFQRLRESLMEPTS